MKTIAKVLKKIPLVSHFISALLPYWERPTKFNDSKFRGAILSLSESPDVSDTNKKIMKEYLWNSRLEYFNKCKNN